MAADCTDAFRVMNVPRKAGCAAEVTMAIPGIMRPLTKANIRVDTSSTPQSGSHWHSVTRFGRHGDVAVQSGTPFKRPVLLAKTGSVFWPEQLDVRRAFIGQGLGGTAAPVSLTLPETVQQGYAPVVPIHIPETPETIAASAVLERV